MHREMNHKHVVWYIRDFFTNKPIGVFVGVEFGDDILIGWSFCNDKDHFNKKRGKEIAYNRALLGSQPSIPKKYFYVPEAPKIIVERNLQTVFPKMLEKFKGMCERKLGVS